MIETRLASYALAATAPSTTGPDAGERVTQDLTEAATSQWLLAAMIFIGAIVLAIAINRVLRGVLARALGSGIGATLTGRLIAYVIVLLGLFYALRQLNIEVGPLVGALGLSGLVLALAFQKVAENFVGGMILQTRRPFTVGDTIELGDHVGVVRDIDARTVVLRGLDGTSIRVPNGNVLNDTIINLTKEPLRRSQLDVGVAYDTNLEHATDTLTAAVARVQRVRKVPRPFVVLREFGASSIDFTIFYWHASDVPSELATTHDLMLAVHHAFADTGITIAFPQLVVWPSHDATDNPYHAAPSDVYVDHPIDSRPNKSRDTSGRKNLLSRWRSP